MPNIYRVSYTPRIPLSGLAYNVASSAVLGVVRSSADSRSPVAVAMTLRDHWVARVFAL